ncbi:MAG: hypothetical protein LBK47_08440 [Prevotellaceae bacterium]|jgi:hypothetical protein|nr:hypothetical protein [Prevotellaceae bacterium]
MKKSSRNEWLARVALTALMCTIMLNDASAAATEDASLKVIGDKLRNMILLGINTVAVVVAVVMVAVKGLGYAMKDSAERGEEDAKKLKSGIIRIAVGTTIAMSAGTIGTFFVASL